MRSGPGSRTSSKLTSDFTSLKDYGICIGRRKSSRISEEAITRNKNAVAKISLGSFETATGNLENVLLEFSIYTYSYLL